ncbi:MAG: thiamine-phosphate kinase [Spongiibacteraceae bacterium]
MMAGSNALTEFELISRYFSSIGYNSSNTARSAIDLGIGDDCAILSIPPGQRLALSIDTMVAGRHFPEDAAPYDIGQRLLAVSISDLAAMGAKPLAFTLALTVPQVDPQWLEQFSRGLSDAAAVYAIPLIGGDTTQGPLTLSVQVHGSVPINTALLRSGAQIGDAIFVSGCLGDNAAALAMIQGRLEVNEQQRQFLQSRFYQPRARVELGQQLLAIATSAVDISDGLLADLGHICKASAVAARIEQSKLPISIVVTEVACDDALGYALTGGDDYELCFTAAKNKREAIAACSQLLNIPITEIGEITAGSGVSCVDGQGTIVVPEKAGYVHFQSS